MKNKPDHLCGLLTELNEAISSAALNLNFPQIMESSFTSR